MSDFYGKVFRGVLFPAWEALRGRRTLSYLRDYERDQWRTPGEIAELRWRRLKALLEHCWRDVPYYRKRWAAAGIEPGDIRTEEDFARVPTLTKDDIRANFEELKAGSMRDRLLYKATGGSTGVPLRFGFTRESNERRSAVMWRGYGWAGAWPGRRSVFLWGGAVGQPSARARWKEKLYHRAYGRHMLNVFAMTEANLAEFAATIDRVRPEIIVAYTGPLVEVARWIDASGRRIHRPVALVSAAEALLPFQRDVIERAFGAPAFNTYGCREFMLIASECERRDGLHVNADHLFVETLSDSRDPGGPAQVAITDLFNYGMPFVRYVNGDLALARPGSCGCGRGLPLLSRVEGRVLDAIRSPDGRIVPGEFFPHMLKDVAGLRAYQVVQKRLDSLAVRVVRGDAFDESALAYIRDETAKVLGTGVQVDVEFVDAIPLTPTGKRRVTICELSDPQHP